MRFLLISALVLFGCTDPAISPQELSDLDQSVTVCATGSTIKGIDVSVFQGTIDWAKAKADGVVYAIIRVSDGLNTPDSKFATNWANSRTAGVIHGAYQFFEPSQDPIAQADMLLAKTGPLKADDLPPMIDVEVNDGLSPAATAAAVKKWIAHVKAKTGRDPIVYTGFYFWGGSVGGANVLPSPLFHAQYTTAACPNIASPWTTWAFWQYTSSGAINGIAGNVDTDRFNGTKAQLLAMLGPPGSCGDGTCSTGESKISCPEDCGPCATIDAAGGEVDDSDACFEGGGPATYLREATDAGEKGGLTWTHATADATEYNYGTWNLYLATAGRYKLEVYTAPAYAQSKHATYVVHAGDPTSHVAEQSAVVDQSAADGWQTVGEYDFAAGGHQWIHLGDNTGEIAATNTQLVFDAIRLTPTDGPGSGGSGSDTSKPGDHAGCNASGSSGGALTFGLVLGLSAIRRRRARFAAT
ncbi:hypothetical protein BH11MYX1_BH11MYX1_01460 [soil metagenome]